MIWNKIFDVKYSYYGYASAAYGVLQLTIVEVFVPRVEQVMKEFIIHHLVFDLNPLDRVCKGLRSRKFSHFFKDQPKFFNDIIFLPYLFNKNEFCITC